MVFNKDNKYKQRNRKYDFGPPEWFYEYNFKFKCDFGPPDWVYQQFK